MTESSIVTVGDGVGQVVEAGRSGNGLPRGTKNLFGVIDMFLILIVVMVSKMYIYIKTYLTVHFKCVQFIICQLPTSTERVKK